MTSVSPASDPSSPRFQACSTAVPSGAHREPRASTPRVEHGHRQQLPEPAAGVLGVGQAGGGPDVGVAAEQGRELDADERREQRHQQSGRQRPVEAAQPGRPRPAGFGSGGASRRKQAPLTAVAPKPNRNTHRIDESPSTVGNRSSSTRANAGSAEASSEPKTASAATPSSAAAAVRQREEAPAPRPPRTIHGTDRNIAAATPSRPAGTLRNEGPATASAAATAAASRHSAASHSAARSGHDGHQRQRGQRPGRVRGQPPVRPPGVRFRNRNAPDQRHRDGQRHGGGEPAEPGPVVGHRRGRDEPGDRGRAEQHGRRRGRPAPATTG